MFDIFLILKAFKFFYKEAQLATPKSRTFLGTFTTQNLEEFSDFRLWVGERK